MPCSAELWLRTGGNCRTGACLPFCLFYIIRSPIYWFIHFGGSNQSTIKTQIRQQAMRDIIMWSEYTCLLLKWSLVSIILFFLSLFFLFFFLPQVVVVYCAVLSVDVFVIRDRFVKSRLVLIKYHHNPAPPPPPPLSLSLSLSLEQGLYQNMLSDSLRDLLLLTFCCHFNFCTISHFQAIFFLYSLVFHWPCVFLAVHCPHHHGHQLTLPPHLCIVLRCFHYFPMFLLLLCWCCCLVVVCVCFVLGGVVWEVLGCCFGVVFLVVLFVLFLFLCCFVCVVFVSLFVVVVVVLFVFVSLGFFLGGGIIFLRGEGGGNQYWTLNTT